MPRGRICGAALVITSVLAVAPTPALAQQPMFPGNNPRALLGVDAVDARVVVNWDDGITGAGGPEEKALEDALLEALRSALDRLGIGVSQTAPNFLIFSATALLAEGRVAYSRTLQFMEQVDRLVTPRDVERDWAITWQRGGVSTVRPENLQEAITAEMRQQVVEFVQDNRTINGEE